MVAVALDFQLRPGLSVGHYELIRELGRGGMGVVYLARDTRLGRRVAIKFLIGGSVELSENFLREARATAACQHENIVIVHEVDEHGGVPYLVLEYLEGRSLRETINGRQLSPRRVVELMLPVARALARAHAVNIVHRDLKPENIFLTSGGTIKVLDFGIAALRDEQSASSSIRPSYHPPAETDEDDDDLDGNTAIVSDHAGTPPYMSPEQFANVGVDQRSDLWALGVMLFETLAGHHPIQPMTTRELLKNARTLDQPMPSLSAIASVPFRLTQLVERCLEKRAERRIQNADEIVQELEALLPSRAQRKLADDEGPYPGLSAFQESEADHYFGRTRDILRVTTRLRETSLAAVIGPSGVGKSSFARAGVIPALKASGERWEAFVLRPGRQPLQSVATILQSLTSTTSAMSEKLFEHESLVLRLHQEPGYLGALLRSRAAERNERILLFVDQFEELYTLVPDRAERAAFLACLSGVADDAAAPLRVLLSLRSDFLDRIGEDKRFADEVTRGLVFLQPLTQEGLREALVAPVEQLGYAFENEEMVGEMVDALATTPGALPLLQFAGSKLWEARDSRRRMLPLAAYRSMGGVSGVLAQHADQVVNALSVPLQRLARTLFQRLITPDGTRAVIELSEATELATDPKLVRGLVDQLVQARLLVVQGRGQEDDATIELVHESLITGWPLLRRWIDEGRDDGAFREQLRTTARLWDARGRPAGLLWRGEAMEDARRWRARRNDALPQKEQEYLDAVVRLATRGRRLRQTAVFGTIAALSLVIAGGAVALVQVRHAERNAVEQAGVAEREAERARNAESEVKAQLEVVEREQAAKSRAEAAVLRGKEDLRLVNDELKISLQKTEEESRRARAAAESASELAASLKTKSEALEASKGRLEKLLDEERERAARLERERGKIATELR
ncbi:MAG TPA: protein kinase [Polyangiaceae bacterium]